jgi:DNA-binding NtrC family response regulator
MPRILVADDDTTTRRWLVRGLTSAGHQVDEASTGDAAIERLHAASFEIVLSDLRMPGSTGLDVLRTARVLQPSVAVILMSGFGSVQSTADAFKSGAVDVLEKPFAMAEIESRIAAVLDTRQPKLGSDGRTLPTSGSPFANIVGWSASLRRVVALAQKVAPSNATVLILGESGTGKELIANAIHQASPRASNAMVKVNCAALQESLLESELFGHERGAFTGADKQRIGRFELADGGTLFLDEIGDMAAGTQGKILRVLQEREFERVGGSRTLKVDVRLIVATNRDLAAMVAASAFREDLYYRLNVVPIEMPPLRERQDDILALAHAFMVRFSAWVDKPITGLERGAEQRLLRHRWPGNVRELANTIERAVVMAAGPTISEDDLGFDADTSSASGGQGATRISAVKIPAGGIPLEEVERDALIQALRMTNWVQKDAAKLLSISARVINYKIHMLKIEDPEGRRPARQAAESSSTRDPQ